MIFVALLVLVVGVSGVAVASLTRPPWLRVIGAALAAPMSLVALNLVRADDMHRIPTSNRTDVRRAVNAAWPCGDHVPFAWIDEVRAISPGRLRYRCGVTVLGPKYKGEIACVNDHWSYGSGTIADGLTPGCSDTMDAVWRESR